MMARMIGIAMRLYRSSPFYPRLGKILGRLLWVVSGANARIEEKTLRGGLRFRLHLDEVIDASLFYSGTFEADAERCIENFLKSGMVAIDIGANVGYHSLRMAKAVGRFGRVIAIEPTSQALNRLRVNAELNDLPALTIVQAAIGDRDSGSELLTFRSSYRLDGKAADTPESVRLVTLDTLLRELEISRVDFIKCDVDGFEGKVLLGAREVLRRDCPRLFIEVTPSEMQRLGDGPEEFFSELESLGYHFSTEKGVRIPNWKNFLNSLEPGFSVNLNAGVDEHP